MPGGIGRTSMRGHDRVDDHRAGDAVALLEHSTAGQPGADGLPPATPPRPGLRGPAVCLVADRRPRIAAVLTAICLVLAGMAALGGSTPSRRVGDAVTVGVLLGFFLCLLAFARGGVRRGPGWMAQQRGLRWHVVTAETLGLVDLSGGTRGTTTRLCSVTDSLVFRGAMLRRHPALRPAIDALVDTARRQGRNPGAHLDIGGIEYLRRDPATEAAAMRRPRRRGRARAALHVAAMVTTALWGLIGVIRVITFFVQQH